MSWTKKILLWSLFLYLGLTLGAGMYTFIYAKGYSYLSNDPRACVNCHIMREQYDGWQKASHHGFAACNDCHVPHGLVSKYLVKAENGFWHSKGFTLQDFEEPIRMRPQSRKVVQSNCLHCHGALVGHIAGDPDKPAEALDCLRCHADVGHGPRR